ncbi:hypothetical protein ACRQV7_06155 [Caproiciproducens sp. R2]|uniref:hypothetical protein n=1 Tax=Caproiciproducens sp. R2 TaxID=3435187 RepID=UPI0040348EBA
MKKWMAFCIGMAILTALAGCGSEIRAIPTAQSAPKSSQESGSDAAGSSQISESSGSAVQVPSKNGGTVSGVSSAIPFGVAPSTISAEYKKGDTEIRAEYPQFEGNRYAGVDSQMKKEALSTMDNVKADSKSTGITAETAGRVEFSSKDFVSAVFETSFLTKDNTHTFRSLRTVNYDLKAEKAVMEQDLIVNNGALYKAADAAVKKQLSKELQTYFTPQVLKDSLDQSELYFKKDGIVVSFTVIYTLGDHAEISIPYNETQGFRTESSVWNNFAT